MVAASQWGCGLPGRGLRERSGLCSVNTLLSSPICSPSLPFPLLTQKNYILPPNSQIQLSTQGSTPADPTDIGTRTCIQQVFIEHFRHHSRHQGRGSGEENTCVLMEATVQCPHSCQPLSYPSLLWSHRCYKSGSLVWVNERAQMMNNNCSCNYDNDDKPEKTTWKK